VVGQRAIVHTDLVNGADDRVVAQAEWQRRQARVRRLRDFGLLLLALGVLVLVYVALLATSG